MKCTCEDWKTQDHILNKIDILDFAFCPFCGVELPSEETNLQLARAKVYMFVSKFKDSLTACNMNDIANLYEAAIVDARTDERKQITKMVNYLTPTVEESGYQGEFLQNYIVECISRMNKPE